MPETLAVLMRLLEQARSHQRLLSYREVLDELKLAAPQMRRLTTCLEQLSRYDHQQGWPQRAALVVSQAGNALPRSGFFDCLQALGGPALTDESAQKAWHALEVQQVFAFNYPEELPWGGGN